MAAILLLDHSKTEIQNVQYSNVVSIPVFNIEAPTVYNSINKPWFSVLNKELKLKCYLHALVMKFFTL